MYDVSIKHMDCFYEVVQERAKEKTIHFFFYVSTLVESYYDP